MRRFFQFWWDCSKFAFWGNTAFANDWQWVFGIPALSGVAGYVAVNKGVAELSTGYPILDGFLAALGAFVVTWMVAFLVRLLNAPVDLFHHQKDRADRLEGIPPPKPRSSDKNLAILQKRYLSDKPALQREILDYEVDGLQAINDVTLILNGINDSAIRITKVTNRHARKIKGIRDSGRRRVAISKFADDLNIFASEIDDYAAIFSAITPAMFEYSSNYFERSPQAPKESYVALGQSILSNVNSTNGLIQTVENNKQIVAAFRGISGDLTSAADRLDAANTRLIAEISNFRTACEKLHKVVAKRM